MNIAIAPLLDPQDLAHTDTQSNVIDLQAYDVIRLGVSVGVLTGVNGSNTLLPVLQESDTTTPADFTNVAAADIIDGFTLIDSAGDDSVVQYAGYCGEKRYLRVALVYAGTGITAGVIGVFAVYSPATSHKISRADVKTCMAILVSTYDSFIDDMIDYAYGYLDNFIGFDGTTGRYNEYRDIEDDHIQVSAMAKDITLVSISIDGNAIDVLLDVSRLNHYTWEITNEDYQGLDVSYTVYTSANITARVKKILMEVIVFELNKMPVFNNSISKKTTSIEGQTTETFIGDDVFYSHIAQQLNKLFAKVA